MTGVRNLTGSRVSEVGGNPFVAEPRTLSFPFLNWRRAFGKQARSENSAQHLASSRHEKAGEERRCISSCDRPLLGEVEPSQVRIRCSRSPMMALLASLISAIGCLGDGLGSYHCAGAYVFEVRNYDPLIVGWTNSGRFEVFVNDSMWRITLQPEPETSDQKQSLVYKRFEAASDGESIFEFIVPEVEPQNAAKLAASGRVERAPVPQRLDARIRHIWLGLASGWFFKTNSPGYLPRLALPPEELYRHDAFRLQHVRWGYREQPALGDIPDWVVYEGAEKYGPTGWVNQDDPYRDQTNVFMSVSSRTNVENINLPAAFFVEELFDNRPIQVTSIVVTSIQSRLPNSVVTKPPLTMRTLIFDRRLTNQPTFIPVQFLSTDWPSLADSERAYLKQVKMSVRGAATSVQLKDTKKWVAPIRMLVLAAMASSIVALLFVVKKTFRKKQE